jgi:hypothetical protein
MNLPVYKFVKFISQTKQIKQQLRLERERQSCTIVLSIHHQNNDSKPVGEYENLGIDPKNCDVCVIRLLPMQLFSDLFVALTHRLVHCSMPTDSTPMPAASLALVNRFEKKALVLNGAPE